MALLVEFAKMRRLKVWLVAAIISAGTLLFASMQLFSSNYVAQINDPATTHWQSALLFYAMVEAMTAPILVAVIASRLVEVEHVGNGWTSAETLGQSRARLCVAKVAALTPVVAATTLFELVGLVIGGRLAGATAPLPMTTWTWYAAASFAVTIALLAAHVWLSARVEQQLVSLGIGVLGAFAGVFAMLMPSWLARGLPWGYYAVASPYGMTETGGAAAVPLEWLSVVVFLALATVLLAAAFRSLDREN
ncbi:MAG: ABC transporter permease [Dermatophilus congolensis]|nr:ABC transporter permease [Dermatophilus congolensis]